MALERVLTKLRFDDSVSGYALFTNDGNPFLSFSLPDETLPIIQGTMRIHSESLKFMNVLTSSGIMVLARVDSNWVLGVLFNADEVLGSAMQKTQDVVNLMDKVELPPPPSKPAEPVPAKPVPVEPAIEPDRAPEPVPSLEEEVVTEFAPIPLDDIEVRLGCVVFRGPLYIEAMKLDSDLNKEVRKACSTIGIDLCLMIDDQRTVFKMAESLGRSVEAAIEAVKWCVSRHVMRVECPEEQELGTKEIVEVPLFEGNLKKAKKEHRTVLELCDGNRHLQEIADMLNMPYFQALQSIVPYRGKMVKFIRKAKDVQ
ncbi:MAG: hypothetical protein KAQ65_10305 [Candidatus Thorarchaeota archaeon]|nr:hypothetical protein [Candidatus Thorarchaeota archaeon]MCK5240792.1 hypothetical protein [Candidatus Thorarchaeota archaeon]